MARSWRLTVRQGSSVDRESFETAEQAIAELERRAEAIRAAGPLDPAFGFRDYGPGDQVAARLEVSGPRRVGRGREAGLDVMGDGRFVAYTGSILKRVLDRGRPIDALREALEDAEREAGRRVRLPRGAGRPITVFINGIEKQEGSDYAIHGSDIEFTQPLVKEEVSRARWLVMLIGLFGSYGRNDVVDVHYRKDGETRVASDLEVVP